jgi:hypothetical protein
VLGRYQGSGHVLVREHWAWQWARRNALFWTPAMERYALAAIKWYEPRAAAIDRKFAHAAKVWLDQSTTSMTTAKPILRSPTEVTSAMREIYRGEPEFAGDCLAVEQRLVQLILTRYRFGDELELTTEHLLTIANLMLDKEQRRGG